MDDRTQNVLKVYRDKSKNNEVQLKNSFRLHDTGQISFIKATLSNESGDQKRVFQIGEPIVLKINFGVPENLPRVLFSLKIHEDKFGLFGHSSSIDECTDFYKIDKGEHILEIIISSPFLPGSFFVTLNAAEDSGKSLCCIENAISFEITRKGFKGRSDYLWTESCAPCFVQTSWKIDHL